MRIAFITAGAAGMFCGSCMRDNTLAAALRKRGHDALLIPTYTPIRTDEPDVSQGRVFFGGINVFLQQKAWLFRHTPWLFDRLLDFPRLLRYVSRYASRAKYSDLYDLTHSMLRGRHGKQRKELAKLTRWLADDVKPEVVLLTNALLSGLVADVKQTLGVPVLVTLQGDDVFLDAFEPKLRQTLVAQIRGNDAAIDGYICTSAAYADHMAAYLGIDRAKMHVVYPGINLAGYSAGRPPRTEHPLTIGYFARVCREKGFQNIVDAFIALRKTSGAPRAKLKASGWLGENDRPFFAEQVAKLTAAGLASDFEYVSSPDHASKVAFFQSIDVFSVPASFHEPKGLYVLEAWANGVPVVQPRRGAFPELIAATGGGVLVEPDDPLALAAGLRQLLEDAALRARLGAAGAN
ncbi:MAG TPA: glycosyltransferase family 4 protein, partial [Gemmataceae bacterium]|nr:glycosyltransferase family 4 protein [Gemmataceae bacterium]